MLIEKVSKRMAQEFPPTHALRSSYRKKQGNKSRDRSGDSRRVPIIPCACVSKRTRRRVLPVSLRSRGRGRRRNGSEDRRRQREPSRRALGLVHQALGRQGEIGRSEGNVGQPKRQVHAAADSDVIFHVREVGEGVSERVRAVCGVGGLAVGAEVGGGELRDVHVEGGQREKGTDAEGVDAEELQADGQAGLEAG